MSDDLFGALIARHTDESIREARRELADDIARAEASGDPLQILAVQTLVHVTAMRILNQRVSADEFAWHHVEQPDKPN